MFLPKIYSRETFVVMIYGAYIISPALKFLHSFGLLSRNLLSWLQYGWKFICAEHIHPSQAAFPLSFVFSFIFGYVFSCYCYNFHYFKIFRVFSILLQVKVKMDAGVLCTGDILENLRRFEWTE